MKRNSILTDKRVESLSQGKARLLRLLLEREQQPSNGIQPLARNEATPMRWPVSGAQHRLWFIEQLEGGSAAYHLPVALRLLGELHRECLQESIDTLVRRHESLRTVFASVDGEPLQTIVPDGHVSLDFADLSATDSLRQQASVLAHAQEQVALPFDLERGPLLRCKLLCLGASEHVLVLTFHHIIADGWSIDVLIRELLAFYEAHRRNAPAALASPQLHYADYAQWQRQWLDGKEFREQLSYWKQQLAGAVDVLQLPTDRSRPPVQSYDGATVPIELGVELVEAARGLARRFDMTLAMVLHAAWCTTLYRLSGQGDVVVGLPVANRHRAELRDMVGLLVSTLAVRVRLDDELQVADVLWRVKESMLGAYAHQDVPFEKIVEALQPVRSLSHSPIFQVMFALRTAPRQHQEAGLTVTEIDVPLRKSQFDITLSLQEADAAVCGRLIYATDLFDEQTMRRLAGYFAVVLGEMAREPRQRISELRILSDEERRYIVEACNATHMTYPRERLIHELFEQQVERTPDAPAVKSGAATLTYTELNARANQLATYLRECGACGGSFVGLCVERDIEMLVAMLGILKSGAAYVPLDPDYPLSRLQYILNDTRPVVVLTQARTSGRLPKGHRVVELDSQRDEIGTRFSGNATAGIDSTDLAYVIYTSGSTGQPKGVAIEHRNAVNLICWASSAIEQARFGRTLAATSLNFDLSVYECFVPLSIGGSVEVVRNALALIDRPVDVTLINTVPSAIRAVADAGAIHSNTRVVNLAGEALKKEVVERIFAQSGVEAVNNLYGPSETTTYSTWVSMSRARGFDATIGRPIANTRIYILDRCGQLAPIGVPGEIYIGGDGVARGYLNRIELTQDRFLADPFSADSQARMYKTGDLGRWRPDGTIEYLGRNDHQVKIRGFRIELGEIEAELTRHATVREAVVVAREDVPGEQRLVAYVTSPNAVAPDVESLRAHLAAVLPDYMIPSSFVVLEQLPLTANGKLDRSALPAPDLDAQPRRQYEAPQGEVEEILAGIWQGLLRVERVGRHDNFFALGGHSLLIVQMLERLRRVGLTAEVRSVFESATLAALAAALSTKSAPHLQVPSSLIPEDCTQITPQMLPLIDLEAEHIEQIVHQVPGGAANVQDIYPLAPLQEGILFHHLMNSTGGDTYIMPIVLAVCSRQRLDELLAALQAAVDRHDVLRTAILWERLPQPVQVVYRRATLCVESLTLEESRPAEEQVQEWISPGRQHIDLRVAPLLRVKVAEDPGSQQWYVLLQRHHLTTDHVALEAVTTEVVAQLNGRALHPPSQPYRNHVAQALQHAKRNDSASFFRAKLGDVEESTAPFGVLEVRANGTQIDEARAALSPALAQRVRVAVRRMGVSAATLFHAAWALVVARTSGRDDVVFGSLLLGRLQGNAGALRTMGLFINTLPLRLRLRGLSVKQLMELTQRELMELLGHEQASLAMAQRCSGIVGSAPLFTALLNYRHSTPNPEAQWSSAAGVRRVASQERTNYPITMSVDDLGEGLELKAQTDPRIEARRIVEYLLTAVTSLVEALERPSETECLALPVMPEAERTFVLERLNTTQAAYPDRALVHELFEARVREAPETLAVIHNGTSLTYEQLNARANRLARHLLGLGVGPEQLVGICVERSVEMVVGLLAILKAGAGYVPLDPNYPTERLEAMLDDAAPAVLLTHAKTRASLPNTPSRLLALDALPDSCMSGDPSNIAAAELGVNVDSLVYVIFTSGSTGRPKGTRMPHGAMVNLMAWHQENLSALGQRVLQFAALSFDVAFQETFSTLCSGGTLVLLDEPVRRDPRALLRLLKEQSVNKLFVPPLMLQSLAESFQAAPVALPQLRDIVTAGEQLRITPEIVNFVKHLAGCRLHNHYGPTETHVVTALTLSDSCEDWPVLPTIGRPIANSRIYVLDRLRQPVPLGVVGEIYIGGVGIARGYLHRDQLSAERFLRDPFRDDPDARMYKTGDVARWRADGTLEYLGRNDDQVKIRGYRIELGEIEARLLADPQVKDVAVIAREDTPDHKHLVAYITAHTGTQPDLEEVRLRAKAVLPEFMVPSAFVLLERLPLTPNGKLDRRALPAPDPTAFTGPQSEAPQGALEQALAQIWQDVLRVARVGRGENFFELGGHSLLGMKLMVRIQQRWSVNLPMTAVFDYPNVREMSLEIQTLLDERARAQNVEELEEGIV